ncbi:MAG: peptide chain release factor 1 [Flavobacteriales bacterium]|jgi:peptide chain release factor 1|nr:peptide chain release factor 1 [Flavobacteriales bacterium]MDG1439515.1 peptide chain release factor 1 [Flavobacteriales bacterium]
MSDQGLLNKLEQISFKYDEIAKQMVDPDIISDMKRYVNLNREYKELSEIVKVYHSYRDVLTNIENAKNIIQNESDLEFKEMAREELDDFQKTKLDLDEKIKWLLIPKDPDDNKNVIMEIRAGTGGDEACIFVEDVFRMFTMFFKEKSWTCDVLNSNSGGTKGFREISLSISGDEVYGKLKFESGVHRVQRVPETESQGRVHTSAITVAVLPEAEEVDFELNLKDVKKDTFRASGAGGQHVNKTESAVRLTHLPTLTVVECQDGRSQHKNYEKALQVLRSRLYQAEVERLDKERADKRKSLVSTGDRSAKIRTYNYPQGRITDHRIGKTIYNLSNFMNGDIQDMIDSLIMAENAEKLNESQVES